MAIPAAPSRDPSQEGWRSLRAVLTVQTQNAFNDNVVRFTLMGIAFVMLQDHPAALSSYKNLIGTLISLPFVLFAPIAGWTSDRFSKRQVIQACLYAQIAIIGAIMLAVAMGNLWLATAGFFVLAIQSAFFAPAKLGIMKELVGSHKLALVSGWMQMLAIVAIVFGSPAGGAGYKAARRYVTSDPWLAGLVPIGLIGVLALLALVIVRRIQPTAAHSQERLTAGVFFRHFADLKELYRARSVRLSSLGIAVFWFAGAFAFAVFTQIAQEHSSGETAAAVASYCLASSGIGIALGSLFVAGISSNRIELGLVPLGAVGMAASLFIATFFSPGMGFYLALGVLGFTSAMFLVPQDAYLQDRAEPIRRGRVLSASNLVNSIAAIAANGAQLVFQRSGLTSSVQLYLLGLLCLMAAYYSLKLLPSNFVRILLKMVIRTLYRLRILGENHIPQSGGALMLSNHVTWIDGLLIGAASPRDVRFVAYEGFFKKGLIGWGLRLFGVIPISSKSARHAIKTTADAINDGHLVCIFPEGTLTRTGCINELQKGFELIVRQTDNAPVVPVYLDQVWGSLFSFSENKFFFKCPRRVPYSATVNFGSPIPPGTADSAGVRDALLGLGLEAYRHRPELHNTLAHASLTALKRCGRRPCMVSRTGEQRTELTGHMLAATALQLGESWKRSIAQDRVAIALPPSSAGVLAHLGLIFAGKTILNLPLTPLKNAEERNTLSRALIENGIKTVITTRSIREQAPDLPWPENVIHFTEELRALNGAPRLRARSRVALSPARWLRRQLPEQAPNDVAVGVFTKTGSAHFLSHREILTQVAQISDTNTFQKDDVMLNFYHYDSLPGQLFGLWLPLLENHRLVLRALSSKSISPEDQMIDEQVSVVIGDALNLPRVRQALAKNPETHCLRMLTTLDRWNGSDAFRQFAAEHPEVLVAHGMVSQPSATLISLSMPNPTDKHQEQLGHRDGANGRPLPGMLVTCEGTPEQPAPLLGLHPGGKDNILYPLGIDGSIDAQGFLILQSPRTR